MASEIRVNTINNSSGLGTITISDTGAFFSGITTISDLRITGTSNAGVTTVSAGSASVPSISPSGDTDTGIFFPAADTIGFAEGGAEAARIDSSGRLLVGTTTTHDFKLGGSTYVPQTHLAGGVIQAAAIRASGPYFCFGASTSVSNNTNLGLLSWHGNDGSSFVQAALIEGYVDGTPGTNDMPGRLVFSTTADGASSPTERMRINNAGDVGIGGNPSTKLHIFGAGVLRLDNAASTRKTQIFNDGSFSEWNADVDPIRINAVHSTAYIRFDVNGAERARINAAGRLLVGSSTNPSAGQAAYTRAHFVGNSSSSSSYGIVSIGRQESSSVMSAEDSLGLLSFTDIDGKEFCRVQGVIDGTPSATGDYPGRLVFACTADGAATATERMRISSNSILYFNTTTSTNYGQTNDTWNSGAGTQGNMVYRADSGALVLTNKADSGFSAVYINKYNWDSGDDSRFMDFRINGGSAVGTISYNGSGTSYNTSSDYRLKENVVVLTDGIDRLKQLNVNRFNFISNPGQTVDGFLAHEVQTVVPEAISGVKDEVDDEGNPVYQGIDQSKLVPLLTAALQEAVAKIETLEANNASLEARLTALEGQ